MLCALAVLPVWLLSSRLGVRDYSVLCALAAQLAFVTCIGAGQLLALCLQQLLALVARVCAGLLSVPANACCLLCAGSCCLPLWLSSVPGSGVSQRMFGARSVLAAVACLCGLRRCWALV